MSLNDLIPHNGFTPTIVRKAIELAPTAIAAITGLQVMHFEPPGGVRVCLSHGPGLQTDFLGHHLAVHIGVAVEHLALFGAPEVELQVVFLVKPIPP